MLPQGFDKLSAKAQAALGLPEQFKLFTPTKFDSMNQTDSRIGMPDTDLFYIENLVHIGDYNQRALWDIGPPIYTASGKTIVWFYFFSIGSTAYAAIFFKDGTAIQVEQGNLATTVISNVVNTFYNSSVSNSLPACSQWGAQYLLICNNITNNSYWVWDGATLYGSGTLSPDVVITSGGSGYTSAPTVVTYGGSGSGATFLATVYSGSVVSIQMTNPGSGYEPGDQVQLYISGGGSDNNAELTANLTSGSIGSVVITNPGSGYRALTLNLAFTGGGGSGAAGTYTADGTGAVVSTSISSGGSGYTSAPSVNFTRQVNFVTITNAGSGYTPGTYALTFSGGGGSGAAGTYTVDGTDTVVSTLVTNAGSGYTSIPTVAFPSGGGSSAAGTVTMYGSGAAGVAQLNAGAVTSVTVVHGGTNFTSTPNINFVGGGGTGATATAVLTSGAISSVTVTNGGSGYTSAPAVEVQSGLNDAAYATVGLMPFGVSGNSIETFEDRVWLGFPNQVGTTQTSGTFLVSAPESFSDFATSDGGLTFTSTDSFLRYQYTNIRQSNGYLYPFGDSSVSVISNVLTGSNPSTTTFNYQNTDPQVGTSWRDSCQVYSRTILFGNPIGSYGLYGGAVTQISKKIDNIFVNAIFPPTVGALTPSSAVANIFSKKVYFTLMTLKDPFTLATVNKMIGWDEKNWFIASQNANLIYIGSQEINSNLYAWGTDGTSLYPLFNTPSTNITKKISTKLYGVNEPVVKDQAYALAIQAQDLSSAQSGVTFDAAIDTNYLNPNTGQYSYALTPISFSANVPTYPMYVTSSLEGVYGMNIGATITSTSSDFTLNFLGLGYVPWVGELSIAGG